MIKRLFWQVALAVAGPAIMLTGWGWHDVARFAAEPARVGSVVVIAAGLFFLEGGLNFGFTARAEARSQALLALFNLVAATTGLFVFPRLDAHPQFAPLLLIDSSFIRWAGLAFLSAGVALEVWAIVALGRWFSPRIAIQPGHELIVRGPYAYLRHPFYTGLVVSALGFPAVFGSWLGMVMIVAIGPVILHRINVEERLLEAEFGDRYRTMVKRTKRLIPFVY
jgi:protein-S-isoprenylcysteine O-methyltransferase Ste14